MAITEDASGLIMLENLVAQLQQASPQSLIGQSFNTVYKAGGVNVGGQPPGTMTIPQLIARVQAVLLNLQQLPQV
jgi:hypothetical protein